MEIVSKRYVVHVSIEDHYLREGSMCPNGIYFGPEVVRSVYRHVWGPNIHYLGTMDP